MLCSLPFRPPQIITRLDLLLEQNSQSDQKYVSEIKEKELNAVASHNGTEIKAKMRKMGESRLSHLFNITFHNMQCV